VADPRITRVEAYARLLSCRIRVGARLVVGGGTCNFAVANGRVLCDFIEMVSVSSKRFHQYCCDSGNFKNVLQSGGKGPSACAEGNWLCSRSKLGKQNCGPLVAPKLGNASREANGRTSRRPSQRAGLNCLVANTTPTTANRRVEIVESVAS
jgi:hypothetical protein